MNPAPTLVNDWITAPFMWIVVGIFVAGCIGVWVGRIVNEDRLRQMDLKQLDDDIDRQRVAYHCVAHGHAFCHPEIHDGQRMWRCENCGDAVVSDGGWVA